MQATKRQQAERSEATLKIEGVCSSETSLITEEISVHTHCHEDLMSNILVVSPLLLRKGSSINITRPIENLTNVRIWQVN
jgi:hypothetical protein